MGYYRCQRAGCHNLFALRSGPGRHRMYCSPGCLNPRNKKGDGKAGPGTDGRIVTDYVCRRRSPSEIAYTSNRSELEVLETLRKYRVRIREDFSPVENGGRLAEMKTEIDVVFGETKVKLVYAREPGARDIIDRARRELAHHGIRPQGQMTLEPIGNVEDLSFRLVPA